MFDYTKTLDGPLKIQGNLQYFVIVLQFPV